MPGGANAQNDQHNAIGTTAPAAEHDKRGRGRGRGSKQDNVITKPRTSQVRVDTNFTEDVVPFDLHTRFAQFSVPKDTEAWKAAICPRLKSEYNVASLHREEQTHMEGRSPFGAALARVLGPRAHEQVVRTTLHCPNWLEMLSRDDEPSIAAEIYTNVSRGMDITMGKWPMKRSRMKNYKSCFEGENETFTTREINRLKGLGYLIPWAELRKHRRNLPKEPIIISAMSCVMRKDKCRLCVDMSRADKEGQSVNEIVGDAASGQTFYTTVSRAMEALCPRAYMAKADVVDCFLLTPLSERSILLSAIEWHGEVLANVRLSFGTKVGPFSIQDQQTSIQKDVYRRCRTMGLPTGTIPKYRQPPPRNKPPARGHAPDMLVTCGLILDDHLITGLSLRSTWFGFYTLVTVAERLGIILSAKTPEKSAAPTKTLTYMGIQLSTRTMQCSLLPERCEQMRKTIQATLGKQWITRKAMMSLIGVMSWAAICIQGPGRAAYRALIDTLTGDTDKRPTAQVQLTEASKADLDMWEVLLKYANGATITKGMRTPVVPFIAMTDASHARWAWHTSDGEIKMGKWPDTWHSYIGYESEHATIWISHLEALCVLFCIRALAPACVGKVLRVYCDSLTTIYCIRKHSSKSRVLTRIIKNIEWLLVTYAMTIDIRMVASEDNVLSDYATRIGTDGFSAAGFDAELSKLKASAQRFQNYQRTISEPAQPQYLGILKDHTVELAEHSIVAAHEPRAQLWGEQLEAHQQRTHPRAPQAPPQRGTGSCNKSCKERAHHQRDRQ